MAKTLYLIRHAKSSWDNFSLKDFDRPLNKRGKENAPEMASRLLKKVSAIDAFYISPALRTRETAACFTSVFTLKETETFYVQELYLPTASQLNRVVENINNRFSHVAVFSHNNGITDYANQLTDTHIDNIPTCGIFAVTAETDSWATFFETRKEFLFFDAPKLG